MNFATRGSKAKTIILFSFAALCILSSPAWADAGTPLMWLGIAHLFIGNFVLGAVEGLAFAWFLKEKRPNKIYILMGLMVLANYISMFLGAIKPPFMDRMLGEAPLYHVQEFVTVFFFWAYFLTLLAEWPFMCIGAIFCLKEHRLIKSILGCLVIQTVSCAIVACMYYSLTFLPPREMIDPGMFAKQTRPGWVYFLDKDAVYRIRLNGTQREFVIAAPNINHFALEPSPDGAFWDLRAIFDGDSKEDSVLLPNLFPKDCYTNEEGYITIPDILDFRPKGANTIKLHPQNGAGAIIEDTQTQKRFVFMMHGLHFFHYKLMWLCGFALPGDLFGFEMGNDIVLLDYPARKAAILTHGQHPIFVPEGPCVNNGALNN